MFLYFSNFRALLNFRHRGRKVVKSYDTKKYTKPRKKCQNFHPKHTNYSYNCLTMHSKTHFPEVYSESVKHLKWNFLRKCDALRDLVLFVLFKKREKHP